MYNIIWCVCLEETDLGHCIKLIMTLWYEEWTEGKKCRTFYLNCRNSRAALEGNLLIPRQELHNALKKHFDGVHGLLRIWMSTLRHYAMQYGKGELQEENGFEIFGGSRLNMQ